MSNQPTSKQRQRPFHERVTDKFYIWFGRQHPKCVSVVQTGFTRANMRAAFEAGARTARRMK